MQNDKVPTPPTAEPTPPTAEPTPPTAEPVDDYVAAIEKLKRDTVSKEDYDKLVEERKKLLEALVKGDSSVVPHKDDEQAKKDKIDKIKEFRNSLYYDESNNLSNIEYVQQTLDLRNALIESGHPDPFLPIGLRIAPTQEDIQAAERVADVFQQCLDYADGDNALFTAEFQRRTMNVPMPSRKR